MISPAQYQERDKAATAVTDRPTATKRPLENDPLVSTSITQQNRFELYRESVRVKRSGTGNTNNLPPDRAGTSIQGFSSKSRSRLRFTAVNAMQPLISQFGLTYHNGWPVDGRICKKHLNAWLVSLRRIIPDIGYLWIMEFQKRNAPHFHIFLSVPPNEEQRIKLASAWCRITSPDDNQALEFHQHQKNWIDWDMGSAQYLAKYLDKESQKHIPEGYFNFGRFWGNSRNIRPVAIEMDIDDLDYVSEIDEETGEIYGGSTTVLRWLGRLAEKQTNGYSRFRKRVDRSSYTMLQGARAYIQIEEYFSQRHRLKYAETPF